MGREGGLNEPDSDTRRWTKKNIWAVRFRKATYVQYVRCQKRGGCKEEFRPRVAFFPPRFGVQKKASETTET